MNNKNPLMLSKKAEIFFLYSKKWIDEAKERDKHHERTNNRMSCEFNAVTNLRDDIVRAINKQFQNNHSAMMSPWNNYIFNFVVVCDLRFYEDGKIREQQMNVLNSIDHVMEDKFREMFEEYINIMILPSGFEFTMNDDRDRVDIYLKRLLIPIVFRWLNSNTNEHRHMIKKFTDVAGVNGTIEVSKYVTYYDIYHKMSSNFNFFNIMNDDVNKLIKTLEEITKIYDNLDKLVISAGLNVQKEPVSKVEKIEKLEPKNLVHTEAELDKLTVNALRTMLSEKDIKISTKAKKSEIITALLNVDKKQESTKSIKTPNSDVKVKVVKKNDKEPKEELDVVQKKKSIPRPLKIKLWKDTFGDTLNGTCYVCDRKIEFDNFDVSQDETTDSILKIVCKPCKHVLKTENLEELKQSMSKQSLKDTDTETKEIEIKETETSSPFKLRSIKRNATYKILEFD